MVLDLKVFVQKTAGLSGIGVNASHLSRSYKYIIRTFQSVEFPYGNAVEEIKFRSSAPNKILEAIRLKLAPESASHQTTMTCDVDATVPLHGRKLEEAEIVRKPTGLCLKSTGGKICLVNLFTI